MKVAMVILQMAVLHDKWRASGLVSMSTTAEASPLVREEGRPVAAAAGRRGAQAAVEGGVGPQPLAAARGAPGAAQRVVRVHDFAAAADSVVRPPARQHTKSHTRHSSCWGPSHSM